MLTHYLNFHGLATDSVPWETNGHVKIPSQGTRYGFMEGTWLYLVRRNEDRRQQKNR